MNSDIALIVLRNNRRVTVGAATATGQAVGNLIDILEISLRIDCEGNSTEATRG